MSGFVLAYNSLVAHTQSDCDLCFTVALYYGWGSHLQGGSVLLDGHPLRSLDPSWLRGHVLGFISQEPVLFATTVRENIRYGRPSATDDEVSTFTLTSLEPSCPSHFSLSP